jgi:uncharacterized protein
MKSIEVKTGHVLVRVRVQPRSSSNSVRLARDGRIRIALTAPPVDGEANRALVKFMADRLGLPKRAIRLVKGETSREKTLRVEGMDVAALRVRLHAR